MLTRRSVLAAAPAMAAQGRKQHYAVIGAGAFGGWTALHLLRMGARVTLVDAWGPGNSRASSGGETRIIRMTYSDRIYVDMTVRALDLWRENEKRWNRTLYRRTGFLLMYPKGARPASPAHLREARVAFDELTPAEAARRYPQIDFQGLDGVIDDREAGFLTARRACAAVVEALVQEGGEYRQQATGHPPIDGGALKALPLSDGSRLEADGYVFACGPWMGQLFPGVVGSRIAAHRKEVFFFGTPPGDVRYHEDRTPCWSEPTAKFYGIPGNEARGFKIGEDLRVIPFDPTSADRTPSREALDAARGYLAMRFPGLKGAPLVESRVCQYENSPDRHFILDRHPGASNVWLVGGGSGHGFKMGPAVGERAAQLVLGRRRPDAMFSLARFP